ncbi:LacI family DNA-binding transcriptional regulator [Sphaerisporangium sp. NPDC005288]|uniref:LacI family DNA-binding transcriptional regulator n=1 Tax=Sphaerisporangium sp. NPDC005288 TaxID=3155114 RepID=UPI0033A7084A
MRSVAETRRGRPTMNDVAATAGVALKTVSRVVNDEPGVNAATAERVRQAIELLGYRRNDGARVLRRGRTASIGLIIEDVADPFYSGLSRAVEDVALRNGSLVFTGSSGEDPQRERALVLAFCARRVDGLVIVPAGYDHGYLAPELAAGIRAVFADRPTGPTPETDHPTGPAFDIDRPTGPTAEADRHTGPAVEVDTVLCDNAGGAATGVAHLIAHGHRRIAFLGDQAAIFTAQERLRGYRQALEAAGLPYDPSLVSMGVPEQSRVSAAVADALALGDPPTALFTGNGQLTVAALRSLPTPRPAIVGFDDFELADLLDPAITVVAQDPIGLGRTAAELLFRRLAGENGPVEHIQLPTHLIPRGSGELPPPA